MAKRILSLLLVFWLLAGCASCGTQKTTNNSGAETLKGSDYDEAGGND